MRLRRYRKGKEVKEMDIAARLKELRQAILNVVKEQASDLSVRLVRAALAEVDEVLAVSASSITVRELADSISKKPPDE